MNYFEQELRRIVEHCEYIRNPKYVGRSCIGRLDEGIVVKMEFESTMIRDMEGEEPCVTDLIYMLH